MLLVDDCLGAAAAPAHMACVADAAVTMATTTGLNRRARASGNMAFYLSKRTRPLVHRLGPLKGKLIGPTMGATGPMGRV
jgi:hypothetical protein